MTVPPARQNHPAARFIPPRLAMKIATYSDWQAGRSSSTDRVCLLAGVEPYKDGLSAQRFPASTRSNCGTAPDRVDSFRFHRRPDGKHQPPAQRLHIFGCRYEIVMRRIKLLLCGILYCMYGKDFSRKVPNFTKKHNYRRSRWLCLCGHSAWFSLYKKLERLPHQALQRLDDQIF